MKIGLALGAGGARGLAHIGALRAMEEAGLEPVAVAGTSMGAIVGALIAAGLDAERITDMITDRSRLTLPSPGHRGGLIGHHHLIEAVCRDLPDRIESLRLPFTAVAVDISRGEAVGLDRGLLEPALAATVALPGLLEPVEIGGRYLVDGGVLNAVPVDVVRGMTQEPVIAIDVTPARSRKLQFDKSAPLWQRFQERLTLKRRPLTVDVILKSFDIAQSALTIEQLRQCPPDIHVRVDLDPTVRIEDFHRHEEVIEAGYRSTREALEEDRQAGE
jgi:NTE family protein